MNSVIVPGGKFHFVHGSHIYLFAVVSLPVIIVLVIENKTFRHVLV